MEAAMKTAFLFLASASLMLLKIVTTATADTVDIKDGSEMSSVIKKVADGKVTVDVAGEETIFDILTIASMDFNTPHLLPSSANPKGGPEAVASTANKIDEAAEKIRLRLTQIQGYWGKKASVEPKDEA